MEKLQNLCLAINTTSTVFVKNEQNFVLTWEDGIVQEEH